MLEIEIPASEFYDETRNEFITTKQQTIKLEHSLVSISKWESKWHKSFLSKGPETFEENVDYVRCMTLTQNVSSEVYQVVALKDMQKVINYINDPMTATTINGRDNKKVNREIITSELIYYWMIALEIPMECQKWHLNRLLTLIQVCNIKNSPPKKMSKKDLMSRNASLNAARRNAMKSKG